MVKVAFVSGEGNAFEQLLNDRIEDLQYKGIKIIDIKYPGLGQYYHTALVIYNE